MRPVLALATALGTVFAFCASAAHAQYTTYDEFGRPHVHHPSG